MKAYSNTIRPANLQLKVNAFKLLFDKDPDITFTGVIDCVDGEAAFLDSGSTLLAFNPSESDILTLEIDGEPVDCCPDTASEDSFFTLSCPE